MCFSFLTDHTFWQASSTIILGTGVWIATHSLKTTKANAIAAANTAREIAAKKAAIDWLFDSHNSQDLTENIRFIIKHNADEKLYIRQLAIVNQKRISRIKGRENDLKDALDTILMESQRITFVLNYYEHLAVAIHEGIFDEKTIKRSSRSSVLFLWKACEGFIADRKKLMGSQTLYCELEALVNRWQ